MPKGPMKSPTKDELREEIEKLKQEIQQLKDNAAERENIEKDLVWALDFLGITADVDQELTLFKQQVIYTAYQLGRVVKSEET